MANKRWRRFRVTADPKLQIPLVIRVALYWLSCLLTVAVLYGTRHAVLNYPMTFEETCSETWKQIGPALLASLFFLPLFLVDVLVTSNKFAGPLLRLRRSLKVLADGDTLTEDLRFRPGDFLTELADDLNGVNRRLSGRHGSDATIRESTEQHGEPAP